LGAQAPRFAATEQCRLWLGVDKRPGAVAILATDAPEPRLLARPLVVLLSKAFHLEIHPSTIEDSQTT
jgi:hypothetical protein